MSNKLKEVSKILKDSFPSEVIIETGNVEPDLGIQTNLKNEVTIVVLKEHIKKVLKFLKTDKRCKFQQLIDVCGVDYLHYGLNDCQINKGEINDFTSNLLMRFAVVYHLLSLTNNCRIRIKTFTDDSVDSITEVWDCANWYEREVFDMYGIKFNNHPDLNRILTDYDFSGHPLRKDFPLIGEKELFYDEKQQKLVYEDVTITDRRTCPKVVRKGQVELNDVIKTKVIN